MSTIKPNNIFSALLKANKGEVFEVLLKTRNLKIERIVSKGQATPENTWLKENSSEWVILLKGKARLLFKNTKKAFVLKPGDYVYIPANTRHRVEWTHPKQKTIWLAIHVRKMHGKG
jgi:cupin 2 domain-containing protein